MKSILTLILSLLTLSAFASNDSIVGFWRTIDDKTNKPKSIVQIYEKDDVFYGKVVKSLDDKGPKLCQKCPGEFKGKPILGLQIMWGFTQGHYNYTNGKVIDPETGDIYSGTLKLKDDGQKLQLRGYIGIPMFGRSQTWERVDSVPESTPAKTSAKTSASTADTPVSTPASTPTSTPVDGAK